MSAEHDFKITAVRIETEPNPTGINTVALTDAVPFGYAQLLKRYQSGFHDLLVLAGPAGQSGTGLIITDAAVCLNSRSGSAFEEPDLAINGTLKQLQKTNPDRQIYGVGTTVGVLEDAQSFLHMYPLYIAGGTTLYPHRPQRIPDAQTASLFTNTPQGIKRILPENIYQIQAR